MALTFLLGGARSGKSELAVQMGERSGLEVAVIVTGEERDGEMAARIARHRARRPGGWTTIEAPVDLGPALREVPAEACVILDCLTLWVANLMERGDTDGSIEEAARSAAELATRRRGPTIVVSNEVGSGIVPMADVSRRYRDLLGTVNAIWARDASRAALVVAGRPLPLEDPEALLG
jgi:adenosylcobinamide kinase / adenosylcobinamide-phosphate guanylyltransferase